MKPLRPPRIPSLLCALGALLALVLATAVPAESPRPEAAARTGQDPLVLATATGPYESGLLADLLPVFERRTGLRVRTLAVGSGAALRKGAAGEADVLLTHAPDGEEVLFDAGEVATRARFMEGEFVIAGPPDDPAGVGKAAGAAEALRRIAALPAPYLSRGGDSGTRRRERALLAAAGLDPEGGWRGFEKTGSGMGATLRLAGERRAYVLSDLGAFLAVGAGAGLVALSKPDPALRTSYSVLLVSNRAGPLASFFLEEQTQRRIAAFGRRRFGRAPYRALRLGDG